MQQQTQRSAWPIFAIIPIAIGCMFLGLVVGGVIGFFVGNSVGATNYIHSNCIAYPFLLLNPQQYVACKLP